MKSKTCCHISVFVAMLAAVCVAAPGNGEGVSLMDLMNPDDVMLRKPSQKPAAADQARKDAEAKAAADAAAKAKAEAEAKARADADAKAAAAVEAKAKAEAEAEAKRRAEEAQKAAEAKAAAEAAAREKAEAEAKAAAAAEAKAKAEAEAEAKRRAEEAQKAAEAKAAAEAAAKAKADAEAKALAEAAARAKAEEEAKAAAEAAAKAEARSRAEEEARKAAEAKALAEAAARAKAEEEAKAAAEAAAKAEEKRRAEEEARKAAEAKLPPKLTQPAGPQPDVLKTTGNKKDGKAAKAKEKKQPTGRDAVITAERTDYDRKEGVILFDRNVYVDDEQYQLHADRLFLFLDGTNDLKRLVALGNVAITNEEKNATCSRAVYVKKSSKIVMYGEEGIPASLYQGGTKGSTVKGERITFWLNSEQVEIERPVVTVPGGSFRGGDGKDLFKNMKK